MRQPTFQDNWLPSWKSSYHYDLLEIYGVSDTLGYAYAYNNRKKHTLELLQKAAKPGAKILDVAAAQGNFTLLLRKTTVFQWQNMSLSRLNCCTREHWKPIKL